MKKNTYICIMKKFYILEEEEEKIEYEKMPLGELGAIIDMMEDEPFPDKRKVAYKEHIKLLNKLFEIYNKKAGWKAYKIIK